MRLVVLLGRRVADVFGFRFADLFVPLDLVLGTRVVRAAVAPHPSRVSTWWNDPVNVETARTFWRRVGGVALEAGCECGGKTAGAVGFRWCVACGRRGGRAP